MTTGERIKARRKEAGVSADELAEKIGVSRSTIFRYENGAIDKVPVDALIPIAAVLHTDIAWLMGIDDQQKQPTPAGELDDSEILLLQELQKLTPEQLALVQERIAGFRELNEKLGK